MTEDINLQIQAIDELLEWIQAHEPQDYERQFLALIEERRKLYRTLEASRFNPAAAAYGESQKGKSYLMSNLLQSDGKPFMVRYGDNEYDFIAEMNPKGDGSEATGVVTRFTSFARGGELYSAQHPLLMRTLSITDIVMILADGYYNDLRDYKVADNIKEKAEEYYNTYINYPRNENSPVKPDDLLEMECYVSKYINNAQSYPANGYFKRLALVADRIPVSDYGKVFGVLWNHNDHFSGLFNRLSLLLGRLNYAQFIYLPIEAVLLNNDDHNTIMSVQCLHGTSQLSTAPIDVHLAQGNGYTTVSGIRKCDLAAICAEVIVKIPDELLQSQSSYCLSGITDEHVLQKINRGAVNKDILTKIDLLDFPGARSRKKEDTESLSKGNILTTILLRGKVAYLFNKYNESKAINVLLFCHDNVQSNVPELPTLVSNWVDNYVGNTTAKRAVTVESCGGVSPLFYIATMFNKDMQRDPIATKNSREAIRRRWTQRFANVVFPECFNGVAKDWVCNWTEDGEKFANSYLLRDYKYSGNPGSCLYTGFSDTGVERTMDIPAEYYDTLRETFIDSDDTALFFADPRLAWDVAATINNDGALYIIEKLGIVATHIIQTRDKQFLETVKAVRNILISTMQQYVPAADAEEQRRRNIGNAFALKRGLDFACNADNYYFGHLLQGLQLKISEIHDLIHDLVVSGALNKPINEFNKTRIIRESLDNFEGCSTEDQKWQRLMNAYNYQSRDEAIRDMTDNGVDIDELMREDMLPQLPSYIIANKILGYWKDKIKSADFNNTYATDRGLSPTILTELANNLTELVDRYPLIQNLHNQLKEHTDIAAVNSISVPLISDIISTLISNFVTDMGYSYIDEDKKQQLREMAKSEGWPIYKYIDKQRQEYYNTDEIARIFDNVLSSGNALTPAFKHNYFSWQEYVFISFIMRIERARYSAAVCKQLTNILSSLQTTDTETTDN